MDFNSSIDIIIKDLREAREIIDDLKSYQGVPLLQVELAKSKCRSAEELIGLLKTATISQPEKSQPVTTIPSVAMVPPAKTPPPSGKKEMDVLIEISHEEPAEENRHESVIIADTFSDRHNSLNEQLGNKRPEDDISSVIKSKPVHNLPDAIGLNDKFLFMREIFGGNQSSYNDALEKLNNAESISDARAIIMSYTGDREESEAVKLLLEIVKRKFPFNG